MSDAKMGAVVHYCGHDATFIADIFRIGSVNVVKAAMNKHVDKQLTRPAREATHHLSDFPHVGCWMPDRGVFIVPHNQVKEIADGIQHNGSRTKRRTERNRKRP